MTSKFRRRISRTASSSCHLTTTLIGHMAATKFVSTTHGVLQILPEISLEVTGLFPRTKDVNQSGSALLVYKADGAWDDVAKEMVTSLQGSENPVFRGACPRNVEKKGWRKDIDTGQCGTPKLRSRRGLVPRFHSAGRA